MSDRITDAIQQAIDACLLFSDTAEISSIQLYLESLSLPVQVPAEQIEVVLTGKSVHTELPNGGAIVRTKDLKGQYLEVGFMQIQVPTKPEAWMYWFQTGGQVEQRWSWGNRFWAIAQVNAALETMGLALNGDIQIAEF